MTKKIRGKSIALIGICFVYLLLRLSFVGDDMLNTDGSRWYRRSENFLTAVKEQDLASTYQHYQPGVSLMWLNSLTRQTTWSLQDLFKSPRWSLENADDFVKINRVSVVALNLVLFLIFIYSLVLINKLYGERVRNLFGLFFATEPYIVGIDRWFHVTSLEVYFSFAAFLTFLVWFKRPTKLKSPAKDLLFVGILVGISSLSKITGALTLVFVLLILLVKSVEKKPYSLRNFLASALIIVSVSALTFFVLFPALWIAPVETIQKIISAVFGHISEDVRSTSYFGLKGLLFYPLIVILKTSPFLLLGGFVSLSMLLVRFSKTPRNIKFLISPYFLFLLLYFVIFSVSDKKVDRYALVFFPVILLGVARIFSSLPRRFLEACCLVTFLGTFYMLLNNFPVVSSYYNPLLGGEKTALKLALYDNSGEYFAQSAMYLNSLARPVVYVPNNNESFSYFYKGSTVISYEDGVSYYVASLDYDRTTPFSDARCPMLEKTFGPHFEPPVVYVYKCF